LQAGRLDDYPVAKTQAFQAATTKVKYIKIPERFERGVQSESTAYEAGFLVTGEDADIVTGGRLDADAEITAVCRVPHRAGGDKNDAGRRERRGLDQQFPNGGQAAGHALLAEFWLITTDPSADAGVDGAGVERGNGPRFRARRDEQLDGVAADIYDRDGGRFFDHGFHG
jgi:hypothetical protein